MPSNSVLPPKLTPGIVPLPLQASPQQVYARLGQRSRTLLLESSKAMPGLSGWSWVTGPDCGRLETTPDGQRTELAGLAAGGLGRCNWSDPFEALRDVLTGLKGAPSDRGENQPPFVAGLAGFLGYDLARHVERLPEQAEADPPWPWMRLLLVDHLLAFDHARAQWYFCAGLLPLAHSEERRAVWADTLSRAQGADPAPTSFKAGRLNARTSPEHYRDQVRMVLEAIAAGDLFQANLSHRLEAGFEGDAFALYRALTARNPAPFSAYLEGDDFALASVSPERFLQLSSSGTVVARPIKGTLPRGADGRSDERQREALAASVKDRAENLMIVDLMRNDLGRVARVGSVEVLHLFELEAHPSVWQMVSTVRAQLAEGRDVADLLRACWPPGSMTGAPKVRAMQLIDSLEPVRRGPYAGSIGYFDVGGAMDLSVVIRTAMVHRGRVMLQVGGGVVADSLPQSELDETHAKGQLLMQVLGEGGPGRG